MFTYSVCAKISNQALDKVAENIRKIGFNDIEKILIEIEIATITAKRELTEDELTKTKEVFMEKKGKLEKALGWEVVDIVIKKADR